MEKAECQRKLEKPINRSFKKGNAFQSHRLRTYLLVIQFSGQRKSSRVRIHVEYVVGPVADHRIRDDTVHALVLVHGQYVADFRTSGRSFAHVERIHALCE